MKKILPIVLLLISSIWVCFGEPTKAEGLKELNPVSLDDVENSMSTSYIETSPARIIYDIASIYEYELVTHPSLTSKGKMNLVLREQTPKQVLDIVTEMCEMEWASDGRRIIVTPKEFNKSE